METKQKKKQWVEKRPTGANLNIFGKSAPQVKELEGAVLGAIMLESKAFDLVSGILKPESFYSEQNQLVYKAIVQLATASKPTDFMMVVQQLKTNEQLDIVGGPYGVTKLTESVVSSANIEYHARIIAEKYILRELAILGAEMQHDAFEDSADVFDLLDQVDGKLSQIISGNNQKPFTGITEALVKSIQRIEELRMIDSDITGIPSRFQSLNKITHGWQKTDLIILAARPSVGKTAFAGNIIVDACKFFHEKYLQEKKTNQLAKSESAVFFSLEMSVGQLVNRMLSCESEIWLEKISNGKLEEREMMQLYKGAVETLSSLPLFIDDTASLNIFELRAKCRRLKNNHNLGLIVIDYLQLMSGVAAGGNREQEISKISRDLKGLAKELQVPIMALSQLSRETEKRSGDKKIPQLSDLRESGAIEQDADMVMFLYRPEYYDIKSDEMGESNKGETHVKIAKHRNGSLATIKLKANLAIQKFTDYDDFEIVKEKLGSGSWVPVKNHFETSAKNDLPF